MNLEEDTTKSMEDREAFWQNGKPRKYATKLEIEGIFTAMQRSNQSTIQQKNQQEDLRSRYNLRWLPNEF